MSNLGKKTIEDIERTTLECLSQIDLNGKTFKVDQRTKIEHRRDQKIGVGSCVKVDGDLDREGNFFISEIEQKRDNRCR